MQFRQQTLANGLEIVAECNPQAYSASYAFFVRTGSRDENDANSGVSHFLEHMVFKGTPTRTSLDVNRQLDELSSNSNAFTNEEQTVYYATTLPEDQRPILGLLSDIMRPSLRQEDFETEKKVILEEIAKYDDQPPYGAHEKCMAAYFGEHPLGRSILGTAETITALKREQMLEYFETRYSPKNIVLAAAGNIDFDSLVDAADKFCGAWKPFEAPRQLPPAPPRSGFQVLAKPQSVQQYIVQASSAPSAESDARYAARVLATIVGDDSGSRLFWELVDTGDVEYAAISAQEFQGTGMLMTSISCPPDSTADILKRISDVLQDVEDNGVTEEELQQAKNKICAHIVLQAERPTSRVFSVGNGWLQRRQYRTVREVVDSYRSVTLDHIETILKQHPLTIQTTVAIGPLDKLAQPA
jgi:predicted Zn-dependent peptidase